MIKAPANEQEKQATVQHIIGMLCLLQLDGPVFKILAKRRGLPFGETGEIIAEKPYQRAALVKIVKEYGQHAESLKDQKQVA